MSIAFIVKGQSFFKVAAPLVTAASRLGIPSTFVVYETRRGKEHDDVTGDIIEATFLKCERSCMPEPAFVRDDAGCLDAITQRRIEHVVVQDAQAHFPFLLRHSGLCCSSIGVFTDTMHWARLWFKQELIPEMTYFPDELCKRKTEELCGHEWPGKCLGSPMFDHTAWLETKPKGDGSVLLLSPDQRLLSQLQKEEIEQLRRMLGDRFRVLQRKKHAKSDVNVLKNDTIPYRSLSELAAADIHINCYSISGFEAQFLGRPMLNLETELIDASSGNVLVKSYRLDEIYERDNRVTIKRGGLIDAYERFVVNQRYLQRVVSDSDVETLYSTAILRDVMNIHDHVVL